MWSGFTLSNSNYSDPLISVIMATYNGDRMSYVDASVESILKQTYENFELIIVIDGPVDEQRGAFLQSLKKDRRVVTVQLERNLGPASARNHGIRKANGEFIAIMDADDLSLPERFANQLKYLTENKLDLISSCMDVINERGDVSGFRKLPSLNHEIRALAPYRCPLHNPSAFGRANVFNANPYDEKFRVSEDYDLWVRLLVGGYKLGNMPVSCVCYRQGESELMKRRGLNYAICDWKVKVKALKLVPLWKKPFLMLLAFLNAGVRMLPAPLFALCYRVRMLLA